MNLLVLVYDAGGREGVGVEVGDGVRVGDAKAQVDDINATSEIANRSMDKPR